MMSTIAQADKCEDKDLFAEGAWLALHTSLLTEGDYVQIALSDFAKHASLILGMLVELQGYRRSAAQREVQS